MKMMSKSQFTTSAQLFIFVIDVFQRAPNDSVVIAKKCRFVVIMLAECLE
ncbi:hypothetical protein BD560DRAFT_412564 [Blakeslea trispora]|nr:hypothetical protein BD560DRAFT_412564 [Blakeslea trispora]